MSLITDITTLKQRLNKITAAGETLGFVPTMGYLHEGHLSLIKQAKKQNDIVVVSVFVNPTQFAPHEDYDSYPRDIERDYRLAIQAGADIIFHPDVNEIYPKGASTFVEVEGDITKKLCGESRPSHFKGVTTVVNILFNIINPDRAYFGQKDAQQVIVLKKMVKDMHMRVNIVVCPIVREADGLAMSSRNTYLSDEERKQALILNQALFTAHKKCQEGERSVGFLKDLIRQTIKTQPLADIEYIEILDATTLEKIENVERIALAAVAVRFGKTRLIDNVFLEGVEKNVINNV